MNGSQVIKKIQIFICIISLFNTHSHIVIVKLGHLSLIPVKLWIKLSIQDNLVTCSPNVTIKYCRYLHYGSSLESAQWGDSKRVPTTKVFMQKSGVFSSHAIKSRTMTHIQLCQPYLLSLTVFYKPVIKQLQEFKMTALKLSTLGIRFRCTGSQWVLKTDMENYSSS